jgi:uroporphyrinogen-III synthase
LELTPIRILLTRPSEDSAPLAALLKARGHDVLTEPMLTIEFIGPSDLDERDLQGIVFTSANGVRAYALASTRRDLPAYAVGDRTAEAAQSAGFDTVFSAGGDVTSLATLIQEKARPIDGALLHPAGSAISGDLQGVLAKACFKLRRVVLYDAKQKEHFSAKTAAALRGDAVDMILFYSPRTAATFVRLGAEFENTGASIDILCLSQAVADAAQGINWRCVYVAPNPTQADLLAVLDERLNIP